MSNITVPQKESGIAKCNIQASSQPLHSKLLRTDCKEGLIQLTYLDF